MDITMPYFSGQEMLGNVVHRDMRVVFLAKESNYLHQSIKAGRYDCLLKPLVVPELRRTLKRLLTASKTKLPLQTHNSSAAADRYNFRKLALPTTRGFAFIEPKRIIYCQAEKEYTRLITSGNRSPWTSLKESTCSERSRPMVGSQPLD